MENFFVVIGYDQNQKFLDQIQIYQQPLQEFSTDLDELLQSNDVAYLTFYDLLV